MTTTKRESILEAIKSMIIDIVSPDVIVTRSVSAAYDVDENDVIVVHRGADDPIENFQFVTDRVLEVLVSVVTRSDVPESRADQYFQLIQQFIMDFNDPDIADITEGRSEEPKYAGADGRVAMVTMRFRFQYRTNANSLVE
jgi:hypothetical protein